MKLSEIIREVSDCTGESYDTLKTNSVCINAINEAYKRIAKEKYQLSTEEVVTLDATGVIDTKNLSKTFFQLNDVTFNDQSVEWKLKSGEKIRVMNMNSSTQVTVDYIYLPSDLKLFDDAVALPNAVEHRIIAYWAAYKLLKIDDADNADYWLDFWNDGFNSIKSNKIQPKRVKDTYGW